MNSPEPVAPWSARERLLADGYIVLERLLPEATVRDLNARIERILAAERERPFDPGYGKVLPEDAAFDDQFGPFRTNEAEHARLMRRIRHSRAEDFDTPWPVSPDDVCISFLHIPSLFDGGRSQRIFNLINKDPAFAVLIEHPVVLDLIDGELGRDAILSDVSVNHVGANTGGAGWHVDTPVTQVPEPFPDFTLSIQTAWMSDFTTSNGATRVARGSHLTRRRPHKRERADLDNEVALTGPAGSVAVWLSQTWHRHGPNSTDAPRTGVIVQYGRAWVKQTFRRSAHSHDRDPGRGVLSAAPLHARLRLPPGCPLVVQANEGLS